MKIDNLKQRLKKSSVTCGVITLAVGALFGGAFFYEASSAEDVQKLESDKSSLQSMISQKMKLYEDARNDFPKFKVLSKNKIATATGLEAAHERLSLAIPMFAELKKSYRFNKLNYTISATAPSTKVTSTIFDVIESNLNIDFVGVSDEFLFSFLQDLKYTIPGFAEIKNFDMTSSRTITNQTTESDSVSGKVDVIWRALKDKSVAPPAGDPGSAFGNPNPQGVPM